MKVYFSCSITGGRNEERVYRALVEGMLAAGHEVPTAHLSSPDVIYLEKIIDPVEVYTRDMRWLDECDVIVAEVSTPSHGVGYEIALGLVKDKPVFCCYQRGKRISKIITGNTNPALTLSVYDSEEEIVQTVLKYLDQNAPRAAVL
jgi:2'-deoxynucleoside 5'-phosphate N-hydrolase